MPSCRTLPSVPFTTKASCRAAGLKGRVKATSDGTKGKRVARMNGYV